MSSYKEIYENLCRICLSYSKREDMVSLIENFSEDGLSDFGRTVLSFVNISIKTSNNFPNSMCKQCLILLKQAVCFKLRCESSDKKLKQWNEMYQQTKDSGVNIEEIVVDTIIFSKYFPEEISRENNTNRNNNSNISMCSVVEESEKCKSETSSQGNNDDIQLGSDIDCSNELLNLMEKNIGIYPRTESLDYKTYIHKKLLLRKRKLAKLQAKKYKHLQAKNSLKIKSLKQKILANSAVSRENLFCNTCNKEFANPSTYRYHMQLHNGFTYICEHCGKGFPLIHQLNQHQLNHHGIGPFIQCKLCNFKAARNHDLNEHMRIHTGERPFTCDKCGLTFRRRAIWKNHMIYHMEKTVQCPQCPKKFYRHCEMLAHTNSMHERTYLYACDKCNATYAKNSSVRRHLTEKHGIPREEQGKVVKINKRS